MPLLTSIGSPLLVFSVVPSPIPGEGEFAEIASARRGAQVAFVLQLGVVGLMACEVASWLQTWRQQLSGSKS